MNMPEFEYLEPPTVGEACALLAEDPEGSAVFAGGTDVLVYLKEGANSHRRLVSLRRIDALHGVDFSVTDGLVIRAMATVNQVARHDAVREHYPGLVDAALCLAADQVRNQATVGGNLCMAVPSADTAPIMLALDARLRVASTIGERVVPIREFFRGPRQTVLEAGEIVVAIEVAPPPSNQGSASLRQGGRVSLSLPIASAAAVVRMEDEICAEAAVALGALAPTPIVAEGAGNAAAGRRLTPDVLEEAGELASAACRPIDDLRASAAYRLQLVKVLTRRALVRAAERAR